MAIDEINASGGVLGQKLQLTQYDIDTTPTAAEEATRAALAAKPFAVLGPQFRHHGCLDEVHRELGRCLSSLEAKHLPDASNSIRLLRTRYRRAALCHDWARSPPSAWVLATSD